MMGFDLLAPGNDLLLVNSYGVHASCADAAFSPAICDDAGTAAHPAICVDGNLQVLPGDGDVVERRATGWFALQYARETAVAEFFCRGRQRALNRQPDN